jgi:hypothetical protein
MTTEQVLSTYQLLREYGVTAIAEKRDDTLNGAPATSFIVHQRGYEPHKFWFAKGNHMSREHMETVMVSYLRSRTDATSDV